MTNKSYTRTFTRVPIRVINRTPPSRVVFSNSFNKSTWRFHFLSVSVSVCLSSLSLSLSLLHGSFGRFSTSYVPMYILTYIVYELWRRVQNASDPRWPVRRHSLYNMCVLARRFRAWVRPDVRYWFRPSFPVTITIYVF